MKTKTVFEKTTILIDEVDESVKRMKNLKEEVNRVSSECPHEVVIKYKDNDPKNKKVEGHYICPACMTTYHLLKGETRDKTPFDGSRVIPITDLSLKGSRRLHLMIRNEVMNNMDYYYNYELPTIELSMKMEEVLKREAEYYETPFQKFIQRIK